MAPNARRFPTLAEQPLAADLTDDDGDRY